MGFHGTAITRLPPYQRLLGPITQGKFVRLLLIYLSLLAAGSALIYFSPLDSLNILGLGLILPGGGFVAHADLCTQSGIGHLAAAIIAFGVFGFSLVLWFGTGNILAPPMAWLGAAGLAAAMRHGGMRPDAPGIVLGAAALAFTCLALAMGLWFGLARRQRKIDNAYLASQDDQVDNIFTQGPPSGAAEMSLDHLQRLRFALDRALQPLDQFNGFERIDQFQTAATRYQLNFLAYGVALTQARFMPAFGGYMHEAQIALLDKQKQHRVWAYWRLENLWGNLRNDPDPMARENIMFTGFVALQMALFRASTGRGDFAEAGRFTLTHPSGRQYRHDSASLVANLEREFAAAPYFLIACEPNWVYPLCNTIGGSAMLAMDAQTKQARWAAHASDFRHHLETEFLDGFGRYIPCRSARTGLPFPALGGVMPLAMPCFFLNALAPDLARRQWVLLRRRLFDKDKVFRRRAFWRIDTGNYGFSRASAYTATALAAAELGDGVVYSACMEALEDECPSVLNGGVMHRRRASVWAHGVELMALASARDGFSNLIADPHTATGIRLEGIAYPDVLVASAHADAHRLDAVLYAGDGDGVHDIGLAGLAPAMPYRVNCGLNPLIRADAHGRARFSVFLTGRTLLHVELDGGA